MGNNIIVDLRNSL